jgi:hypothetical protein
MNSIIWLTPETSEAISTKYVASKDDHTASSRGEVHFGEDSIDSILLDLITLREREAPTDEWVANARQPDVAVSH